MSLEIAQPVKGCKHILSGALIVTVVLAIIMWLWPRVEALSPWSAGRIIDDNVFYDTSTFSSVQDIQNFINRNTPTCDIWGTGPSEYGGGTRAQYARARGWPGPPYVCLQHYHENPTTKETSFEKGGGWFAGGISAAQIIWDASHEFKINPQVLLVILKKEQGSLFTDVWPLKSQYKYAMGFACPDTGPGNTANCSNEFAGFYNQIRMAAKQLRRYTNRPDEYRYKAGRSNYIQYSPNAACGGSWVYIENQATASLYNYTPYQPTQVALDAYPGTAHCGAYGNRNFWRFFNEWFGSPLNSVRIDSSLTVMTQPTGDKLFTDMTITARFTIRNMTDRPKDLGTMAIAVRDSQNGNHDFGSQRIVLQPWQTYYYTATQRLSREDTYTFWITNYRESFGWSNEYPESSSNIQRRVETFVQKAPTIVSPLVIENQRAHLGQQTHLKFTVKNNSARPVDLGYFGAAITSPSGRNADVDFRTIHSLAPQATYEYRQAFTAQEAGHYKMRISGTLDNGKIWTEGAYPLPPAGRSNTLDVTILPNPTLVQGITFSSPQPRAGDPVMTTFKIKNFASQPVNTTHHTCLIMRNQHGANYDLGCLEPGHLAANQEKEFRITRALPVGTYRAYFATFDGTTWHEHQAPPLETGAEPTRAELRVLPELLLSQGITMNRHQARAGDQLTGTFTVRHLGSQPSTSREHLCYIIRHQSGSNHDLGCLALKEVGPGTSKQFTMTQAFTKPGKYEAYFALFDGTTWHEHRAIEKLQGSEAMKVSFTILPNPTLVQGITFSSPQPRAGDPVMTTFKIKNFASQPVNTTHHTCLIMRNQHGANYDLGCLEPGHLAANQEKEFRITRALPVGTYRAYFATFDGTTWHEHQAPPLETGAEPTRAELRVLP